MINATQDRWHGAGAALRGSTPAELAATSQAADSRVRARGNTSRALRRRPISLWQLLLGLTVTCTLTVAGRPVPADEPPVLGTPIPTGQSITPEAARGAIFQDLDPGHPEAPDMRAGQAAAVAISPDGRTLAILTSGFNFYYGRDGKPVPKLSTEYVFLFDVAGPRPKQLQVIPLTNTFEGLAWSPSSERFFVSGGSDDVVLEFVRNQSAFVAGRTFRLGHKVLRRARRK